jgi:membrane-bound hydrogenase subunit beta
MTDAEFIPSIQADLGEKIVEVRGAGPKRVSLTVRPADLVSTARLLREKYGITHITTISGVDKGETFELIYHLTMEWIACAFRTSIPKADPRIDSTCAVWPGAILYERELQDMFGIVVENIPDGRRLLLPDDWPEGQFPLRKDWTFDRPEEIIPGGQS